MNASISSYTSIESNPFDGTIMPILYIPDWSKSEYQNKTTLFSDIPISAYIPLPRYDISSLSDTTNTSKSSLIQHYTYVTPYMGSYRLNYKEHDGSHNAIDIRAPIGTPVLSIANGVVVRTVEADAVGNKFVVIRHDNVPLNGKKQDLYSGYLHLSEITVQEGTKIRKWDMLGRVGITGITTTPHLHIQIDTQDAPFHPYWPFTSSDSRAAGLWFFESVNAWVGKENALKYSIHPMDFINMYIWGVTTANIAAVQQTNTIKAVQNDEFTPVNASIESIIASMNSAPETPKSTTTTKAPVTTVTNKVETCTKKRFNDLSTNSKAWKTLYQLVDTKCMFQGIDKFEPNGTIKQKDAIIMLMQYYDIKPSNGTSHFLDIAIGDKFQWYALSAYRRWIIDGNYASPEKYLSKEDFAELIVKIGKLKRNPNAVKIYKDTSPMNLKFQYIQDYAYKIGAKSGNFYPQSLLTREWAIEMLGNVMSRDQKK
jgi:hypothetical protein